MSFFTDVAPRVGAWIETQQCGCNDTACFRGAPRVGAWVDTQPHAPPYYQRMSPPAWGRGLKRASVRATTSRAESPPAWGRGLKRNPCGCARPCRSRPPRGGVD